MKKSAKYDKSSKKVVFIKDFWFYMQGNWVI